MRKTELKRATLIEKMTADRLLIEEAAEALGIPRSTAYRIMSGVKIEPPAIVERDKPEPQVKPNPRPKPVTSPESDELTRRYEWERRKHLAQVAENAEINSAMGMPFGPLRTPDTSENRRKLISDPLALNF